MKYFHATNLRVPFDRTDLCLLAIILDYRIGEPIKSKAKTAMPVEQLIDDGYVGLYLTRETFEDPLFRKTTGWQNPDDVLGVDWVT